jgi:hypothetical protein
MQVHGQRELMTATSGHVDLEVEERDAQGQLELLKQILSAQI